MSIKKTNLPYVAEPQVNFFLYPPMHDVLPYESMSMEEKLDLDLENTTDKNFTVYISIPYCRNRCHSCCCFRGCLPTHTDKDIFLEDYLRCLISQIEAYATKKDFLSSTYLRFILVGEQLLFCLCTKLINCFLRLIKTF